jgi:DNA-binding IclR family transcriptional regulator
MTVVAISPDKHRHLAVRIKRPAERRSVSRSASRAIDVLEIFGIARRPLRAVEIARALELTPSSANQLLKTLVDSAHLLFDARNKTYQPSPRLVAIASWVAETYDTGSAIGELVADVHGRCGLVVTFVTHNDLFMQVIDLAGQGGGERGLKISLFGSTIGSAFLATLPHDEVRRLAQRARVPRTEMASVLAVLAEIREAGYASGPATRDDIWSIAVPLPAPVLAGRAVLGLAGPAATVLGDIEGHVRLMRDGIERWIKNRPAQR